MRNETTNMDKELDFDPVVNGVDFLDSAITNLLDSDNPRSLNKLQHFGSTSKHEAVDTRAAQALEVLSQFILQHLLPDAPEHEAGPLEDAENLIRRALTDIAAVTQARLTRLKPELDAWKGIVVHCPDCRQLTWTFEPNDESSQCRFCSRDWSQEDGLEAAEEYIGSILGESRYEAAKGRSGWSISMCPECEMEALVAVATREDPDSVLTNACFHCGFITTEPLGSCGRCGRTTSDPEDVICTDCLDDLAAED